MTVLIQQLIVKMKNGDGFVLCGNGEFYKSPCGYSYSPFEGQKLIRIWGERERNLEDKEQVLTLFVNPEELSTLEVY